MISVPSESMSIDFVFSSRDLKVPVITIIYISLSEVFVFTAQQEAYLLELTSPSNANPSLDRGKRPLTSREAET